MEIFKNRNFNLMFIGRILTNIGDSLYAVAAMWLVYDLGGSTLYTGLAGLLSIFPRVIQLFSGPLIDRYPVRSILVVTQVTQGILLLLVPIAHYSGFLSVGLVLTITPILSTINTWVYPAQMSALPRFLDKKHLTQGNSLFSLAYQGIDVACNAVSGILIVLLGAVSLYVWNSIGFFIGALLFAQLRLPTSPRLQPSTSDSEAAHTQQHTSSLQPSAFRRYLSDMKEGIRYLTATPISRLLFGIIVINAAGGATFTVLPAFGKVLGGAEYYGILLMAQALGSLCGALLAPYLGLEKISLGRLYSGAFFLSGAAWCLSIFSPWAWLTNVIYGLAWVPGGATNVIINTVIQRAIPERSLGTVFAASSGLSGIALPIGSFIGGSLGVWLGGAGVIAACGGVVLLVGCYWMIDPVSRRLPRTEHIDMGYFNAATMPKENLSGSL